MNQDNRSLPVLVLVAPVETSGPPYSLAEAAHFSAIHPELLRYYCAIGLFGEKRMGPDPVLAFDDNALHAVRRIESFRRHHDVGRRTLRLVLGLLQENEALQAELRFLRNR